MRIGIDAIRPPFYQLFLAPVVSDEPRAFADAKLVELAMALMFVAVVGLIAARVFSRRVGVGSAIAVSLIRTGAITPWLFGNHPMEPPEQPPGYQWSLGLLYLVTAVCVVALYFSCRWYVDRRKASLRSQ